jgi:alpha-L-fucosidase
MIINTRLDAGANYYFFNHLRNNRAEAYLDTWKASEGWRGWLDYKGDLSEFAGDYHEAEQNIGEYSEFPWETWMVISQQWSWKPNAKLKSLDDLLRVLILSAGRNGNLMISVPPLPDGRIELRYADRLAEMGKWLGRYGESVYATRGGPFLGKNSDKNVDVGRLGSKGTVGLADREPVVSTRKDKTIYVHVLNWEGDAVALPPIPRKIVAHRMLTGGTATVEQSDKGITITVPEADRDPLDTIVKLELDGSAMDLPVVRIGANTKQNATTAGPR